MEYCAACKPDATYISLNVRKCMKCEKAASFAKKGDRPEYCKSHKPDETYINVTKHGLCKACNAVRACFGLPGAKKAVYCKDCIPNSDYVNLKGRRCQGNECKNLASFGQPGEFPTYCAQCKPDDSYIGTYRPMCQECKKKQASFNLPGIKPPIYCGTCKPSEDFVNVVISPSRLCEGGCGYHSSYAKPGTKAQFCTDCRPDDTYINVRNRMCEGCKTTTPTFGLKDGPAIYCKDCLPPDSPQYVNVKNKKCVGCGLFFVANKKPWKCSYCKHGVLTRKEKMIVDHICQHINHKMISRDKSVGGNLCLRYRPDVLYEANNIDEQKNPIDLRYVVVEIDEHQHESYDKTCERARENGIFHTLGAPVLFIRYNPDKCRDADGRTRRIPENTRLKKLVATIKNALYGPLPANFFDPIFLFYDEDNSGRTSENVEI